jgi:hypothetical protein
MTTTETKTKAQHTPGPLSASIDLSTRPDIVKLDCPITGWGDWHDKPLRYAVQWGSKRQLFSTKGDAVKYGRIWKRVKGDELAAIHEYAATI